MQPRINEVSWNMSGSLLQQIASRLNSAALYYLKGNMNACFHHTRECRLITTHHYGIEQKTEAKKQEKEIASILGKINYLNEQIETETTSREIKKELFKLKEDLINKLYDYRELVYFLLDKYGYMVMRKSDTTNLL